MDTEVYKVQPARMCYEVQFGTYCAATSPFATFAEALAFYRGFKIGDRGRSRPLDLRIVNTERADGSEDGNETGLSDEEREAIEEVST